MDQIDKILTRSVSEILPEKKGLAKLMQSKKIRLYLGVDPTGSRLHLGHTIALRKLGDFANLGHEAILLFGTGTALAGDPSQRQEARGKITQAEIEQNIATWKNQVKRVIDLSKVQIRYNSDWLLKLTLAEILDIASNISAVQLFKRDMFAKRLARGDTVWTHETLYPLLQGYDSVAMDVDLEIGGTDQTFNMLVGRELQKKMNGREKYVLTTPLISGTDGKPMSKSSGNCVWLDDTAEDMFGKIMSMLDSQIAEYWKLLTDLAENDLALLSPLEAKKQLALAIVGKYHNKQAAQKAQAGFENVFQKRQAPEDLVTITLKEPSVEIVDFLVENNLAESKSQAKRLLAQGAVEIDGETIKDSEFEFANNQVVKVGKKKFVRVIIS